MINHRLLNQTSIYLVIFAGTSYLVLDTEFDQVLNTLEIDAKEFANTGGIIDHINKSAEGNIDTHRLFAATLYCKPYKAVTPHEREEAKRIFFYFAYMDIRKDAMRQFFEAINYIKRR